MPAFFRLVFSLVLLTSAEAATLTNMPPSSTLYQLLGVAENAAPQTIHRRYRQLVFLYHPDRNNGAVYFEEKLKKINAAYDILSDVEKRMRYDRELALARTPVQSPGSAVAPVATTRTEVADPDANPPWVKPLFRIVAFILVTAFFRECRYSYTPKYRNTEPAQQVADTTGGASWYLPGYDRLDTPLRSMRIDTNLLNRQMPAIEPLDIPCLTNANPFPCKRPCQCRWTAVGN